MRLLSLLLLLALSGVCQGQITGAVVVGDTVTKEQEASAKALLDRLKGNNFQWDVGNFQIFQKGAKAKGDLTWDVSDESVIEVKEIAPSTRLMVDNAVRAGESSPKDHDFPAQAESYWKFKAIRAGSTSISIWGVSEDGKKVVRVAKMQITVGKPQPPKPDDPPIDPVINYTGLRVVIVYEQSAALTREQVNILGSAKISAYLNAKCAKDEKGRPAWRKWDKDVQLSDLETKSWQDLWTNLKPKLGTLPQICIVTDQKGETFQLPDTEQKTLELLQKYGGK